MVRYQEIINGEYDDAFGSVSFWLVRAFIVGLSIYFLSLSGIKIAFEKSIILFALAILLLGVVGSDIYNRLFGKRKSEVHIR